MKKKNILALMFMLLSTSAFANPTSATRSKFGLGILLPFPIALEINIKNFDIDLGVYNGTNNIFKDWQTLFLAIDYIFYTHAFKNIDNILDFAIGGGGYGTIWFSRLGNGQANSGPMSLGARLPLILNLAITRKKFDIFLKVAPGLGLNIWSSGVGLRWEIFAGIGMRFWVA
ncbi:BAPKO_0422 family outer member beta-barrel protein [Borrelia hermsii]|uniref:DUF3996 domain-containing protein n=3 Tax=Borrelia hermsii TaxID=140 RepID=A0AAN0X536_BORHE|nr:DUF3996 domain-containing protein [Borrelia hermsii]AAX17070.1 hypothetical protein BH0563 [Borrelia hermsii DAH]AJW73359.1 hypothetical protein L283_02820 [Borrelia hermsii CC1]AMR75287.1 hypothetical protein A0V01_01495 [Borrelia hermsii]ANA43368.1 hypothetical protein AXX13_02825 [Borrelia hermsii HS1]UPA07875.1 DUF3996 domain-containing protein [Borrelia hermsii DAH]